MRHGADADVASDLYQRYGRQIHAFCLSRLRDREEAEDATQSTFLNAFRGLQRGTEPQFELAWLFTIASNVCVSRLRSSLRRRRLEAPQVLDEALDEVPAHDPDADELIDLPEALEGLPPQQQRAILLREWQGLTYREIADELDLSLAAVETLLFRARRGLAARLNEHTAA